MKRFLLPTLLAVGLFLTVSGYGQEAVKVDRQFNIQLTESMLLQKSVQLDISGLQFRDEAMAVKFFNAIENNLVEYTVDFQNKTAVMQLFPERLGKHTWTLEQWNTYMNTAGTNSAETYKAFDNQ